MNNTIKALISLPLVLSSVACSSVDTTPTSTQQVSTPTPVVSEFVGKSDTGHTFTFSEDNITTRTEEYRRSLNDTYHVLEDTYRIKVTANGVMTDLTGKSEHISDSLYCKIGESVATRYIKKYHVIQSTGYQSPNVLKTDPVSGVVISYTGEYTQTKKDLGIITSDELKQLRANRPENTIYSVHGEYNEYDHNDTRVLPSKYINKTNIICQAARELGKIWSLLLLTSKLLH